MISNNANFARARQQIAVPDFTLWNIYFAIKLLLYYRGDLQFHAIENLALAVFLLIPLRWTVLRIARQVVAVIAALWLLQLDANLPPLQRLVSQMGQLASFESRYLWELALRFLPDINLLAALLIAATYWLLNKVFRTTSIVLIALLTTSIHSITPSLPILGSAAQTASVAKTKAETSVDLNSQLRSFFNREAQRQVRFPPYSAERQPFDILFLSICSLSWHDLSLIDQTQHPLLQDFDFVFEQFNSATSYSGPALLRLTRASCGQAPHQQLYQGSAPECRLIEQLQQQGYRPALLMNHDGAFDSFLENTRRYGHIDAELEPLDGLPQIQKAFDGSPIYSDLAVLENWWQQRQGSSADTAVAIYNSTSLHDGNRVIGGEQNRGGQYNYQRQVQRLFGDLEQFIDRLQQSNRNVVVVLIPEHGANLSGDAMQIPGMREIPTPALTRVPVAIKLIGPNLRRQGPSARIEQPTSYQALGQLMADFLAADIFAQSQFDPSDWLSSLPTTETISQNEGSTVITIDNNSYLSLGNGSWTRY